MSDENKNAAAAAEDFMRELEEAGAEEAPNAPDINIAPKEEKSMAVDNGVDTAAQTTRLPLFIVFIAGIVLLFATGHNYEWNIANTGGYSGYAISVSCVAIALSSIGLALTRFSQDKPTRLGKLMNVLNFVYSFIGACFLTFREPFDQTSNGYFAAWTIVYGCAMAMGMTSTEFGSTIKGLSAVMGLMASSLVVVVATITPIREDMNNSEVIYPVEEILVDSPSSVSNSEVFYALVLSCVTFAFILMMLGLNKMNKHMPNMISFLAFTILAVCWIIMACLVTFRGPFEVTGNGYFASWAGAATATMAAFAAKEALVDKEEVGAEDAPIPAPTINFDEKQMPLFVVLIASIVLMIATGVFYDWDIVNIGGYSGYAISISSVAILLSFIGLVMTRFAEEMFSKIGKHLNMLCFVYSFVGACFLTFDKPFETTGNGYFSAWAIIYGCVMSMDMTSEAFASTVEGHGALGGLLISSLVVIVASITPIKDKVDTGTAIFAMVLGCVTLASILVLMQFDKNDRTMRRFDHTIALMILAACWIVMACLATFRGPFEVTGNGYFASWAGAITATMASFSAIRTGDTPLW